MTAHEGRACFPEEYVVDLTVTQFGEPIKLKSFRFPAVGDRKGVVFYMHGYGTYANHDADLPC
jgi:hypothetical protein